MATITGKVENPSSEENPADTFWVTTAYLGGGPNHETFRTIEQAIEAANKSVGLIGKGIISVKIGLYP